MNKNVVFPLSTNEIYEVKYLIEVQVIEMSQVVWIRQFSGPRGSDIFLGVEIAQLSGQFKSCFQNLNQMSH